MDALSFLYIALGVGFLLLVIFSCVALIYLSQVLRDVAKITESARDTAERINDYVVQPFALVSNVVDHVKPMIEAVMNRSGEVRDTVNKTVNDVAQKVAKKFKKKGKKSE